VGRHIAAGHDPGHLTRRAPSVRGRGAGHWPAAAGRGPAGSRTAENARGREERPPEEMPIAKRGEIRGCDLAVVGPTVHSTYLGASDTSGPGEGWLASFS
jgi:hypothetical protein